MSTSSLLLLALVDDAALFPPRRATLTEALEGHRRHRTAPYAPLVGRFLCPTSRLPDLLAALTQADTPRLGLIADGGAAGLGPAVDAVAALGPDPRLAVDAVEVPLGPAADTPGALVAAARETVAALPRGVASFVEIPRSKGWQDALDVVAAHRAGAKLRTGGVVAEAFPSVEEVAAFMVACAERGTPFKCTAGLHNATRHRDADTGFEHHGFLNVLLGAHAAATGADPTPLLAERDVAVLSAAAWDVDDAAARATRELFAGYGSCSIDEPVADLTELGLL